MNEQPNLLSYATSELSQDAMLAYFLSYGGAEFSLQYQAEHKFALSFLALIFRKSGKTLPSSFATLKIHRQAKDIDILVEIDDYWIAIEDKRFAQDHGQQLEKYRNELLVQKEGDADRLLCIYIQTGEQMDPTTVSEAGFITISRLEILSLFDADTREILFKNQIYKDFFTHFMFVEDSYSKFQKNRVVDWNRWSRKAFIHSLINEKLAKRKAKGANGGGFEEYTSPRYSNGNTHIFLQVEISRPPAKHPRGKPNIFKHRGDSIDVYVRFRVEMSGVKSEEQYRKLQMQLFELLMRKATEPEWGFALDKAHAKSVKTIHEQLAKDQQLFHIADLQRKGRRSVPGDREFPIVDNNDYLEIDATLNKLRRLEQLLAVVSLELPHTK